MKTILAIGLFCSTTAFAGTGLVITDFSGGHEHPGAIHAVSSNKLLAIGSYGNTPHGGLVRYLSNGAVDLTFGGGNGKVGTLIGTISTTLKQFDTAQGKIIAIGEFNFGSCVAPIIVRYNDDGTLDTSLGGGQGWFSPTIGTCPNAGILTDIKIDGNNRIVISGVSTAGHAVVARYSWSGNPDNSFGTQGVFDVTKAVGNVGEDATNLEVRSLRLANGEIIVAGSTANRAMIARITGTGILDVSFGFAGVVVSPPYFGTGSIEQWTWAKVLADDSILVVGDAQYDAIPSWKCIHFEIPVSPIVIGHYLADGTLDTSYGGNGTGRAAQTLDYTGLEDVNGALDSQGRLLVAASGTNAPICDGDATAADFVAARFTSTGLLDTSFNSVGYTHFAFTSNPSHFDYESGVTVDSTDRPVLLGSPDGSGFGLGCLTTGGVLDTSFGPP